jgi:hypothetical protein
MRFQCTTEGANRLQLVESLEQFAVRQWLPSHATPEQAAEIVLDLFKRTVLGELEMLHVECSG